MGAVFQPELVHRREGGRQLPALAWRPDAPVLAISSGPLGGGIGVRHWILNATVPMSYHRDDPDQHLLEIAEGLGLDRGPGVGLLTGVDVGRVAHGGASAVRAHATVGLGAPIRAAERDGVPAGGHRVGTVNIVATLPVRLSEAALVNTVITVTEAKVQALSDLGTPGTGTCTDAVCLLCPTDGPAEPYGGPRSRWGARLAAAVYDAVLLGGTDWYADPRAWSDAHEPIQP